MHVGHTQAIRLTSPVKMLALGDSYTIGERVPEEDRWPNQLMDSLAAKGILTTLPVIIARTGWRTDDLANAIDNTNLNQEFNLVSILIGVNNFYQGKSSAVYEKEFEALLQKALGFIDGETANMMVLSIPDFAYTPYGQLFDTARISAGIDTFNLINRRITEAYGIPYIDITPISREGLKDRALIASDGLHPSGKMYGRWVSLVLESMGFQPQPTPRREAFSHSLDCWSMPGGRRLFWRVGSPGGPLVRVRLLGLDGRQVLNRAVDINTGFLEVPEGLPSGFFHLLFEQSGRPAGHCLCRL